MAVGKRTVLEQHDAGGYREYRIPGLVVTPAGTILLVCEARMSDGNDWAAIDIILRRSTDGGQTFTRDVVVRQAADRITTFNNPVLIADGDLVHFIWHENYARAYYQVSRDDGQSFSTPVEITAAFAEFRSRYDWTVIASGPGHGIALRSGRLVVPVWLAQGQALDSTGRVRAHQPSVAGTIYSDDHGLTWHSGGLAEGLVNGNETTAVELSSCQVLLNIRHQGPLRFRGICLTPDGTGPFAKPYLDQTLPDPMCFGSTIRTPGGDIFFVNCAHNLDRSRINLTLRRSSDDCLSWPDELLVDPVGGYADIACLDNDTIYCFYERTIKKEGRGVIEQLVLAEINF